MHDRLPSRASWTHESQWAGTGNSLSHPNPKHPQQNEGEFCNVKSNSGRFECAQTWYKKQQSPSLQREPVNFRGLCVTCVCWISLVMKIKDPQISNKLEGKNQVNMMAWSYRIKKSCLLGRLGGSGVWTTAFGSGHDPGVPGSSPALGSLTFSSFMLPLTVSLSSK